MCTTHLWEPSLNKGPYIRSRLKTGFDRWPFSQISSRSYLVGPFGWVGLDCPGHFCSCTRRLSLLHITAATTINIRINHCRTTIEKNDNLFCLFSIFVNEPFINQCNGNNMYIIHECHITGWKRYQYQPLCFAITCASLHQSHGLCWIHHPNWEMYFAAIYNLCKGCCQQLRGKLPAFAAHPFARRSPGIPPICYTPTFMTFNGHLFNSGDKKDTNNCSFCCFAWNPVFIFN